MLQLVLSVQQHKYDDAVHVSCISLLYAAGKFGHVSYPGTRAVLPVVADSRPTPLVICFGHFFPLESCWGFEYSRYPLWEQNSDFFCFVFDAFIYPFLVFDALTTLLFRGNMRVFNFDTAKK